MEKHMHGSGANRYSCTANHPAKRPKARKKKRRMERDRETFVAQIGEIAVKVKALANTREGR